MAISYFATLQVIPNIFHLNSYIRHCINARRVIKVKVKIKLIGREVNDVTRFLSVLSVNILSLENLTR